jgi:flagellar biosynthesis anti-sigma factor FlgM
MADNALGGKDSSNGCRDLGLEKKSMKVNDSSLPPVGSTGPSKAQETAPSTQGSRSSTGSGKTAGAADDVHLSELVRSLRSLAADSPERQASIERLARSYANGTYQVDSQATASKIIDDAQQS